MKSVTMQDIADRAGKTRKVVSEILNDRHTVNISDTTRQEVLRIAREMNYQPNYFAKTLKTGKTGLIGVTTYENLYDYLHVPYVAELISGLGNHLAAAGQKVIFQGFREVPDYSPSMEMTANNLVDGLVYLVFSNNWERFKNEELPRLKKIRTPAVVVHSMPDDIGFPNITVDTVEAGILTARHFLDHGYRHTGVVRMGKSGRHVNIMAEAFCAAVEKAGSPVDNRFVFTSDHLNAAGGYRLADRLVAEKRELPRAMFIPDDEFAFGMMQRFLEAGIRVPGDLAVIGVGDNIPRTSRYRDLSSVRQPGREKGGAAARMLEDMVKDPALVGKPESIKLQPKLTVRNSCGC